MRILLGVIGLLLAGLVTAGGIPTVDIPVLIQSTKDYMKDEKQNIAEKREWVEKKQRDIEEIRELYDHGKKLKEQIDSLNGDYAMGMLLDTPGYRYKRRRIARSFDGIKEGLGTAEEFADEHGVPVDRGRQYITAISIRRAGEQQLARADERISIAEGMIDAIDDDPDNKAALDLNNRLMAEMLISLAEDEKTRTLAMLAENDRRLEDLLRRESDRRMAL